ncbi:OsmC family protein [Acidisphaera sp. S103]|uniref:OsmC family protein n=1 Tax=Acidisphaera sp. S103 TaxID=1747223 RepID=UPI00131E5E79|nr:OsmC family protein [Acidisphaera sp. S103]
MAGGYEAARANEETIILEETKVGAFQIKVRCGCATFLVDEPFGVGGLASGPNPYDLLSAAIGACSLMAMRLFVTQNKWPIEKIRLRITHHRNGSLAQDIFIKEIQLVGPLDEIQRQKIAAVSDHCPVQTTISRGSEVRTVLLSNELLMDTATTWCEHMRDLQEAVQQMQHLTTS